MTPTSEQSGNLPGMAGEIPSSPGFLIQVLRTFRLAGPVMLSRIGLLMMMTADSIMVGQLGADELAFFAAGFQPQLILLTTGIGLMSGTMILSAQACGAGEEGRTGRIWRHGLLISALMGLICVPVMFQGQFILEMARQTPEIVKGGADSLLWHAPGMLPLLCFLVTTLYLEGLGKSGPGMIVSLLANPLNAALNQLFIFGTDHIPQMGAGGANLSSSITRWAMFLGLVIWMLCFWKDRFRYGLRRPKAPAPASTAKPDNGPPSADAPRGWSLALLVSLLGLGLPLAGAIALESSSFATIASFAGRLGTAQLASYQIAQNIFTITFMLAIGLSTASSVRVGNAVGRGDLDGVRQAGWTGLALIVTTESLAAGLFALLHPEILTGFTSDPEALALLMPMTGFLMAMIVLDGCQGTMMGALRGLADVRVPPLIIGTSFTLLAVGMSWYLGIHLGLGLRGFMISLICGASLAACLLTLRFYRVTRRPIIRA